MFEYMRRFKIKYPNLLPIIVLTTAGFIIYHGTLKLFFWNDDFLMIKIVNMYTFHDYLKGSFTEYSNPLFNHIVLGSVFRPVTHYLYWLLGWLLFKTEPLGYHLINLSIHISNTLMVYIITVLITKKKIGSFITSLLYLSAVIVHIPPMVSLHTVNESLGLFFILLSFLIYNSNRSSGPVWWKDILILVTYGLSLLCNERALIFPSIVFFYELINSISISRNILENMVPIIKKSWQYWLILLLYLTMRFSYLLSSVSNVESRYKLGIGSWVFQKYYWGIKWLFHEFIEPIRSLKNTFFPSINFDRYFGLSIILIILALGCIYLMKYRNKYSSSGFFRVSIFGLFWFLIFPLPSLFVNSFASHYFEGAIIGLCIPVGYLLNYFLEKKPITNIKYINMLLFTCVTILFASTYAQNYINNPRENPKLSILSHQILELIRINNIDLSEIDTMYLIGFPDMLFSPSGKSLVSSTAFEIFLGHPLYVKQINSTQEIYIHSCQHIIKIYYGNVFKLVEENCPLGSD